MTARLELPPSGSAEVAVAGRRLRLTSLDKVLWPATGFTKAQLIDYYVAVAGALLGHLAGRPLTLGRFPDGVDAPGFAQTECRGRPDWMRTRALRLRTGEVRNFCLVDDVPALVWVANLGTIELHPYLAAGEGGEDAALVVFDLDPAPGAGMLEAARVALDLRSALDQAGLVACAKTSGGTGMHVYVPLNLPHRYDDVRDYAADTAARLGSERVEIDWRQNHPRRSTIAPYSLRAADRPQVSAPVTWSEVEAAVGAGAGQALDFSPADVMRRVQEHGDLFDPVLELTQRLP
jgi:bifunctional non-homologous end joining protein LigD